MKTVLKTLNETSEKATKQRQALNNLIDLGHGGAICTTYSGTAFAEHKSSNAYQHRRYLQSLGFEVAAEMAGPARQRKSEGYLVFVASYIGEKP